MWESKLWNVICCKFTLLILPSGLYRTTLKMYYRWNDCKKYVFHGLLWYFGLQIEKHCKKRIQIVSYLCEEKIKLSYMVTAHVMTCIHVSFLKYVWSEIQSLYYMSLEKAIKIERRTIPPSPHPLSWLWVGSHIDLRSL